MDGADARTPTPEARHEPGESELIEAIGRPAPPLPPEEDLSPGVCLRQPGLLGRRTPDHNPPPEEGLMLTRGHYGPCLDVAALAGFAGLPGSLPLPSTPPLPGWLQGVMGGPASGKPAASHRQ